jgi:PTH1 family peptidyl-tRNA hydrolase
MNYLLVGLGNIGPEYELTRHNIGFLTLDRLADKEGVVWKSDRLAFKSEFRHKGRTIHLIKPTTYMNLSGKAVNYWMKTLNIPKENILVLVDDVAIPFEKLRMRPKGSAAGHNGLRNIEELCGGQDYPRLRLGIGDDFPKGRQADYVLGRFTQQELTVLPEIMDKAITMSLAFCTVGIVHAMSQYND